MERNERRHHRILRGSVVFYLHDVQSNYGNLTGCNIKNGSDGIHIILWKDGRPSGEAYVQLESLEDFQKALEMHKKNLGNRYIEVFSSNKRDMDQQMIRRAFGPGGDFDDHEDDNAGYVRLRGLPFGCKKQDIQEFFEGSF